MGERLDLDRHVIGVGVEQLGRARHDADMPLPEHEVAAAKLGVPLPIDGTPELCRLHVGIMTSASELLHANAYHMAVEAEPFAEARDRIKAAGYEVMGVRRLPRLRWQPRRVK